MEWIEALREEVRVTSQNKAAQRLGVSAAMVSQVLAGKYPADATNLEHRVRGELMGEQAECPVLGEISKRTCLDMQALPFAATNPQRVKLYNECRKCPFSTL